MLNRVIMVGHMETESILLDCNFHTVYLYKKQKKVEHVKIFSSSTLAERLCISLGFEISNLRCHLVWSFPNDVSCLSICHLSILKLEEIQIQLLFTNGIYSAPCSKQCFLTKT